MNVALVLYLASTPAQRREGASWYPDALDICQHAADQNGHDVFSVVAAMAITERTRSTGGGSSDNMVRTAQSAG